MIDFKSTLGRKAKKLLNSENVIWLTTVGSDLASAPSGCTAGRSSNPAKTRIRLNGRIRLSRSDRRLGRVRANMSCPNAPVTRQKSNVLRHLTLAFATCFRMPHTSLTCRK